MTKHLLILLFTVLTTGLFAQPRQFEQFGRREGLGMTSIHCARQSSDGYIWLGLDGAGLSRFDGKTFTEIIPETGPQILHVKDIIFSGDSILFASEFNGFFYYSQKENKIDQIDHPDHGQQFGDRQRLFKDRSSLYFFFERDILWKSNGEFKVLTNSKLPQGKIKVIDHIQLDQGILFSTKDGWFHLQDGEITALSDWIGKANLDVSHYRFGYKHDNIVTLCSPYADHWLQIKLDESSSPTLTRTLNAETPFRQGERITKYTYSEKLKSAVAITNSGRLFNIYNGVSTLIPHNLEAPFTDVADLSIDFNGSVWYSTLRSGLFKISKEPFVQYRMNPIMRRDDINFTYRINDLLVLNFFSASTKIGNPMLSKEFTSFDFFTNQVTKDKQDYYFATNAGIKKFMRNGDNISFETILLPDEKITSIIAKNGFLWYSPAGKGLFRYNLKTKVTEEIKTRKGTAIQYIYTFQEPLDEQSLFLAGNSGIFKVDVNSGIAEYLKESNVQYSAASTIDKYGTCWFTSGESLLGIKKDGSITKITNRKYFNSLLFYTLGSDNFGNLILGTNKGISIIKVNASGEVLSSDHYDSKRGFGGYETHAGSNFKDGALNYVGTIDGLYIINTKELESNTPPNAPFITNLTDSSHVNAARKTAQLQVRVLNSRTKSLQYRYRLLEGSEQWVYITEDQNIQFNELKSGRHIMEAQASYDGESWSNPSFKSFDINVSIWESSWLIIILVGGIITLNLFLLSFSKNKHTINLLGTESKQIYLEKTPATLLFGVFCVSGTHIIAPLLTHELSLNVSLTILEAIILLILYLTSLVFKKQGLKSLYPYLLAAAIITVTAHLFWEIHISLLYPYHIIGIVLTGSIAPYIFSRLSHSIIYSSGTIVVAIIIVVNTDIAIYPKPYFLTALIINSSLIIFNSHLRYSSLEKLMFVSGIINKGNIPVIAYDSDGKVSFVTENISRFINVNDEDLINKNISTLNNLVVYEDSHKGIDVTQDDLSDGSKYLVPMMGNDKSIRWIEWSYKQFSKNLRVVIGNDVSEKIEIEYTYELLVQNVEDFISTVDVHGNFTFLNDSLLEKMGYKKEDLLGKNAVELVASEFRENAATFYSSHFIDKKSTSYYEIPIVKKDGEIVWVGQHVNTIYAPGSKTYINGYIALARDITERRKQERLIREQRDNITSSINYAQKIQMSLLPHERQYAAAFKEYFIFYRPKDIVSGDFYWIQNIGDKQVIVLGDCTGHGVPGSLMTVLGINLLNNIVLEARITEPSSILNELDKRIIEYLQKHEESREKILDGIEITVAVIDKDSDEISYACAGSRFLIHQKNTFTMFKGNNEHIGDLKNPDFPGYQTQYTTLRMEDTLYLFTDGYQDQFGGVKNKKYSFRRLLELLESNVNLALTEQRNMIETEFDLWKDTEEQTDDVTILSIRRGIPLE